MIYLDLPGLPPSVNHAYFTKGKIRIMTPVGKKYHNEITSLLVSKYHQEMRIFKPNQRYQIVFRFWCERLQNMNWKPNGKVNRYKKFDGGNLTKLLEDCLAKAGGFDDSQTMTSTWQKKQGTPEHTEVFVWSLEDESDHFDFDFQLDHLRSLQRK